METWRKCNVFQGGFSKEKLKQTEAFTLTCNFHKLHIATKFNQKHFQCFVVFVNVFKIW